MTEYAIRAQGLGKLYRLGQEGMQYGRLSESIARAAGAPLRRLRGTAAALAPADRGEIWALRDIDLDVPDGQVLGVVGRNGAGKTTLLKLLSRITEPTTGQVALRGRIGSLLEVGTGFHPELTGRENVYLNGAILGMRRADTARKFDEIVAFAEVERFIDTPVKRYSSGMYLRLAFAVAAHLDPDILIVDEVLAVGDAAFQKKCLGKMQDVSTTGRTVLFVSHNMATVLSLCDRAVLLEGGRLVDDGPTGAVVQRYLSTSGSSSSDLAARADRRGSGRLRVTGMRLESPSSTEIDHVLTGDPLQIALDYESSEELLPNVVISLAVDSIYGERICILQSDFVDADFSAVAGRGTLACGVDAFPLIAGVYSTTVYITVNGEVADWVIGALTIRVEPGDFYGSGRYPEAQDGKLLIAHSWAAVQP